MVVHDFSKGFYCALFVFSWGAAIRRLNSPCGVLDSSIQSVFRSNDVGNSDTSRKALVYFLLWIGAKTTRNGIAYCTYGFSWMFLGHCLFFLHLINGGQ